MRKAVAILFWACVGFGNPGEVTFFLNSPPKPVRASVVVQDGQYQVFYLTDEEPVFWTCPPTAECVNVPQVCR
jgi:hypothetical protein